MAKYTLTEDLNLTEDVNSTLPVTLLSAVQVFDFISAITPAQDFRIGYFKELSSEIAAKFKGGRGSNGDIVRIFKCTEITGCTGIDYEELDSTKEARAAGKEKRVIATPPEYIIPNKIKIARGSELICFIPSDEPDIKTKWFISINDADLQETTKDQLLQYFTASFQAGNRAGSMPTVMAFNTSKVYMLDDLGKSVM